MDFRLKRDPIAVAVSIALSAGVSSLAMAQAPVASQDANLEEIVVSGYRESLIRSEAIKQESSTIVEALTAEDIGKLPDTSIAESLARLPGLAGERVGGRTSGLSVRGFKEDYVGTTLNGRELLGIGDNRGVEYDLYPAEIVSGAVVYKSPEATLSAMGIGGTVDLRTTRPLDAKSNTTFNATYEKNGLKSDNPDFKDTGYRFAFSDSRRFADDTVGLAIALATTHSPTQAQENGNWGWSKNSAFGNAWTPNGIQIFSHSSLLKRDTASAVLQFRPSDRVDAAVDALLINFRDQGIKRGFIEALPDASVVAANGVGTSGTTSGFKSVIRSDPTDKQGTLRTYGINLNIKATDRWAAKFDMAHSDSTKSDEEAESYAGVGRPGLPTQGADTIRTWASTPKGLVFSNNSTDFSDYNLIRLAGPQSWGGSLAPIAALQPSVSGIPGVGPAQSQDGFVNTGVFDEHLNSVRLEGVGTFGDGWVKSVDVGLQYTDHSKAKNNHGYFLTANTWPLDGPIPADSRKGLANLSWAGLGQVVAYDAQTLVNSSVYTRWDAQQLEPDRLGDTYGVNERITTLFGKLDFKGQLGSVNVFGNAGLQLIHTNQWSTGYKSLTGANLFVQATPVTDGDQYNKALPSINVNFDLGHDQIVRAAVSKAISRARIDYLKPGGSVKFRNNVFNVTNTDPANGPWQSNSGNAKLRPLEANQIDLAYEWYFAKDGYISFGGFYKDLINWSRAGTQIVDFHQYYIPGYHQAVDTNGVIYTPATFLGVNTFYQDGLKGKVQGAELQATIPFRALNQSLDGLGLVFSAALTDGRLEDRSQIPGLSKNAYQLTAFYERGGFSVRAAGTKRSAYLSYDRGGSNTVSDVNRQAITLVDAQVSYEFSHAQNPHLKGLRVSLQGQNLTNQDDVNIDSASGQITQYNHYGTNYLLSFKYSL
jgi:iron complex outermembrane recepter protein